MLLLLVEVNSPAVGTRQETLLSLGRVRYCSVANGTARGEPATSLGREPSRVREGSRAWGCVRASGVGELHDSACGEQLDVLVVDLSEAELLGVLPVNLGKAQCVRHPRPPLPVAQRGRRTEHYLNQPRRDARSPGSDRLGQRMRGRYYELTDEGRLQLDAVLQEAQSDARFRGLNWRFA